MSNKFTYFIAGIVICSTILGFSIVGSAVDQNGQIVLAQGNEGEGHNRGKRRGPPPEAIEACQAQSVGDSCGFVSPKGNDIEGVCEIMGADTIACLPDNRPPHGKGKPGGPPPNEEY